MIEKLTCCHSWFLISVTFRGHGGTDECAAKLMNSFSMGLRWMLVILHRVALVYILAALKSPTFLSICVWLHIGARERAVCMCVRCVQLVRMCAGARVQLAGCLCMLHMHADANAVIYVDIGPFWIDIGWMVGGPTSSLTLNLFQWRPYLR